MQSATDDLSLTARHPQIIDLTTLAMRMKEAVLIIAPKDDIHALSLAAVMERDFEVPAVIWDRSTFPVESQIDFTIGGERQLCEIHLATPGGTYDLNSFRSVWWRRAAGFKIEKTVSDQKVRRFCDNECDAFFKGVLRSLRVPIVNNPFAESIAARKPHQLATARGLGIDIPRTLISNDPASIRAFWRAERGHCIYKPLTAPSWTFSETRVMQEEDLEHLDRVRHAPMIVQEKIEKGVDVRVNIFGDAVFACEIETSIPEAEIDWRLDTTGQWHAHDLPAAVGDKLKDLLRELGLQMGCVDLRQQPDGQYRFFEVNPSGQFLFAEIDTGQPLLRALSELLLSQKLERPEDIDLAWAEQRALRSG